MEQTQIKDAQDIANLIQNKKRSLSQDLAQFNEECIRKEFTLFEFGLFMTSIPERKFKEGRKKLEKLRNKQREGKINLLDYEKYTEEF